MHAPRNRLALLLGMAAALALIVIGFVGFLGYFGGPVYRAYPIPGRAADAEATVVYLSGDMGINAGMGPRLIAGLNAKGLPVLAVNSLTAFGTRHSPAQIDAIIADTVRRGVRMAAGGTVVLVGQSFGADMLQFGLAHLPAALRSKVAGVVLLVPGSTVLFKASPGGLLDGTPDAPAAPTARRIDWVPLTCIQGADETHSLCPLLSGANVRRVALPGGHFLNYDLETITRTLHGAIARRR
jgi:type IV secretory pathway VirJ component